ncbi:MAG: TIGR02391 family protein [Planctomycetota bacterium]|nr:TIGR02391 family protein [Planctomycetota bacterium]
MAQIRSRQRIDPFDPQHLTSIAKVLGDTNDGLTGSEIGYLLNDCHIPDVDPNNTKWKRLFNAFVGFQNEHQVSNHVVVFITKAMNPASYTDNPTLFSLRQDQLNKVLAFRGMAVGTNGKVRRSEVAGDLDEAMSRANHFRSALTQRCVHADVLKYCTAEILQKNYFHAVFEAMKSITGKIRDMAGVSSDGAALVDEAFSLGNQMNPLLAINSLKTETEQGEQRGFVSLLKGLYGTVRNPLAHKAKINWDMNEQDALDIMTMISLIHRKLDKAQRYR